MKYENPNVHYERVKCRCGWFNNKPSKAKENVARCRKCGLLINDKMRFKNILIKKLKEREN